MHWTEMEERLVGDVLVLELRGHLTLAEEELGLMRRVAGLLAEGHRALVLKLQHVSYIDSPGIGEIVGAYTRVKRAGGMLVICEASPRVREILTATNLDTVLTHFDHEPEAVAHLAARRSGPDRS